MVSNPTRQELSSPQVRKSRRLATTDREGGVRERAIDEERGPGGRETGSPEESRWVPEAAVQRMRGGCGTTS